MLNDKSIRKLLLYPLFAILTLHLIRILFINDNVSFITSASIDAFIIFIFGISIKYIGKNKNYYKVYLIAIIADALASLLYGLPLGLISRVADVIYLIPNSLYVGCLIVFVLTSLKNWNKYQFFSDIFIISIIGFIIVWSLFINGSHNFEKLGYSNLIIIIYVFLDFFILSVCALLLLSIGVKNIHKKLVFPLLAILTYSLSDYVSAYNILFEVPLNRGLLDFSYKIASLFFTMGAVYEANHPDTKTFLNSTKLSQNLKTPKKTFIFLGIIISFLFIEGFITLKILQIIIFSCIIYWGCTATIRFHEVSKTLLEAEQANRTKLEELVEERTRDLTLSYKKLEEMSNTDSLTGLSSYKHFSAFIDEMTKYEQPFVFMCIDINRFKFINDSYGHDVGDKVLQTLADRLRTICPDNGELFRIGGDEFILILKGYIPLDTISTFAEKILELFNSPLSIEPYQLKLKASIGISLYPDDSKDKEELIRYADIAKYSIKNSINKNWYSFFKKSMLEVFSKRQEIELMYKNANSEQEFILYFQPQFSIHDKKLIGMEALIRWLHPEKGLISPIHFIPVIEDTGDIITLGKLIMRKAFAQIKIWNEKYNTNLRISINVSPKQIEDDNFMEWFNSQMDASGISTDWIDLELTESSYMHFNDENKHIFNELSDLGIKTSIDDFGTGYSSLSYIKSLNFDRLKIAKELIDNIENDENSQLIIKAIIMMSDGLKLKTIAEGVEDKNQLNLLEKLGCDEIQGYIWGRPIPADEFEEKYIINAN
ncbi:MAG: putative bifunctional diguanylate cyclase/phosphodiesterase [Catonella sp.]|uniref:putative bifunctional diguanylate cyclase/phosphodiesterase n=1 Tax=Catonella sp. TaxID=2382125 RepID=UPI003F9EF297